MLAERVRWARSMPARAKGLIGTTLGSNEGLILQPAKQVHTFFMRQPIDVIFCDNTWKVLHVVSPMRPWRIGRWVNGARCAVELEAGAASDVRTGDMLRLVEGPVRA